MKHRTAFRFALLASLVLPGFAFAHPGHGAGSSFAQGFGHPFGGIDHVVLLLAAGAVAGWIRGAASAALLAGLASLLLFAHRDWIMPGSEGWGFVAGFLAASALLVCAGIGVASLRRRVVAARARRPAVNRPD